MKLSVISSPVPKLFSVPRNNDKSPGMCSYFCMASCSNKLLQGACLTNHGESWNAKMFWNSTQLATQDL